MDHPENSVPDFTPLAEIDYQPLPRPRRRAELDAIHCDCGVCAGNEPLYLVQNCHPNAGVDVVYFDGILSTTCVICKLPIGQFEVAK